MEPEWGRAGEAPSDEHLEKLTELLGGILWALWEAMKQEGLMEDEAYFAGTLLVKYERQRGTIPIAAVVSIPDLPEVTKTMLEIAQVHVDNVLKAEKEQGQNGKG